MDVSKFKTAITGKLSTVMGGEPEPTPPEKKPRLPLLVVAAVVVAGLAGGAYFFFAGGGNQAPESEIDTASSPHVATTPNAVATPVISATEQPGFNNSAAVNVQSEPTTTSPNPVHQSEVVDHNAATKAKFEARREKLAKSRKVKLQALYKRYPQRRGVDFTKKREQINKKFAADLKKLDHDEKLALAGGSKPVGKAVVHAKKKVAGKKSKHKVKGKLLASKKKGHKLAGKKLKKHKKKPQPQ